MVDVERCPECGIPKQTSDLHEWLDSGVIVHTGNPNLRLAYVESEILDPLFEGIGQLIGAPVERIAVDAARRSTRAYFSPMISPELKEKLKSKELPLEPIISAMALTNRIDGCGRLELKDVSYESTEDDFITLICGDPRAVLLTLGDIAGACEAVTGNEYSDCSYTKMATGTYEMTAHVSRIPLGPESRLELEEYPLKKVDIEFERCATCRAPRAFENYKWDIDLGTIRSLNTNRRIAVVWPGVIDFVFKEIGKEWGDIVPMVVIEAQRRLTRTIFQGFAGITDERRLRDQMVLRGMGTLKEFKMDSEGLGLHLENACMHLLVLGMAQGMYELAFNKESSVQWEISEEGDLQAEVSPLFTQFLT